MQRRRSAKLLAGFLGLALLATACGDDGGGDTTGTTTEGTTDTTDGGGAAGGELTLGAEQFPECLNPVTQCANSSWMHWAVVEHVLPRLMELDPAGNYVPSPVLAGEPELAGEGTGEGDGPFTVTYTISDDAVWDDGTPITCTDVEFTVNAVRDTTGTLTTTGFDQIASVSTDDDKVCAIEFETPFAAWADLMGSSSQYILKADAFESTDIANDLNTEIPFSGGPWVLESFDGTAGEAILVRNEAYWDEERVPLLDRVIVVRQADQDTELNSLLQGEVAAIYPQPAPGLTDTLAGDSAIEVDFGSGTTYEGMWFNQGSLLNPDTPLADPAVREALLFAVDRETIVADVITPLSPDTEILNCGGWVPTVGEWCDNTDFADVSFDPEAAAAILDEAGWVLGDDGVRAKDGQRLSMTWQTVAGNARREAIQGIVIPDLAEIGIEVTADNSDPETLFQVRLPQMDTEIMLYAQVASPDPSVTTIFHCDNIPSEANEFAGQNNLGWCNEDASALMDESDATPDPDARLELIHQIGDLVREDAVWLPFYQLPLITAYRTDVIAGPVGEYTDSPLSGFFNLYDWSLAG